MPILLIARREPLVTMTLFNVGRRIELHDFTESEAMTLAQGMRHGGTRLLKRVLYWTGGHPYLTQRLCQAVAETDLAMRN
jgi:hypothetical protein